jgi:glycolate oxidase FAD binding subunit
MIMDETRTVLSPRDVDELQEILRQGGRFLPRGGGSKTGLSTAPPGVAIIDMRAISGICEYDPLELTFTARAGTPIAELNRMLAERGQFLPFDPLFIARGATLGGTVAANASGPGRYHYGGVRDFLLGARFVSGDGRLNQSGGKVVKNAAGFDLPKLMVGSLGRLGVLVELSFKVFPLPEAYATLTSKLSSLEEALQAMRRLSSSRIDLDAIELEPSPDEHRLWVRIGGLADGLPARLERLGALIGDWQVHRGQEEEGFWDSAREMAWAPDGWYLVKVPLTPGRIASLEPLLADKPVLRRYSAGGQVAWLAMEHAPQNYKTILESLGLLGIAVLGASQPPLLGERSSASFYRRVKAVLDPDDRLLEV